VIRIFLPDNNLHGNIPRSVTKLPELRQLWLFGNNLGPSIPHYVGDITKLETLFLQNNRYEGDVQPALAKLQYLKVLDLSGMQLGERLVRDNDTEAYLQARNLSYGQIELTGIPKEYGNFLSLVDLDLSYNLLHGPIPSNLSKAPKLERLFLSSNRLNGTVPESFATMTSLTTLTFDLNPGICSNTTGPYPPEHIAILPGTLYPKTCPPSKGPVSYSSTRVSESQSHFYDTHVVHEAQSNRTVVHEGQNTGWNITVLRDDRHRHPLDIGVENETYCGPHASPDPIPCIFENLVPAVVRNRSDLSITWVYPSTGTLAVRDGQYDIAEQTRYGRREHREAGYPFEWLPLVWNGVPDELASEAGLDGILNMWNDNQRGAIVGKVT